MVELFLSVLFAKAYGGTYNDRASSITQTSDGGYAVAGNTSSYGAGNTDFLVIKLSSNGFREWTRTFGGNNSDYAYSVAQASDGGCAVAGATESFGAGNTDALILKLSSDGSLELATTFGGTDYDGAYSIIQTSDGGYAVSGYTASFGAGYSDFLILKLSSDGSLEWAKTFGGSDYDKAYSITQTSDGGCAVAGETWSFGAGQGDFLVLKLPPDGSYEGCVRDCSPTVTSPSLTVATVSPITSGSGALGTLNLPVYSAIPQITDVCESSELTELSPISLPLFSPAPGGLLFLGEKPEKFSLYSVDGRLVASGVVKPKEKISLRRGVYIWQVGEREGVVAVP